MFFAIVLLSCCVLVAPICAYTNKPTCGKQSFNVAYLLQYGEASKPGEWPWHAAIFRTVKKDSEYACGGSIVDERTIVTAAHCFFFGIQKVGERDVSIRVGQVDLNKTSDSLQELKVAKLIIHPGYDQNGKVEHDLAIVKLSSDINMTKYVQPVCLYGKNDNAARFVGNDGTIVGYGIDEEDKYTGVLRHATLTVVKPLVCLANDRSTYGQVLTDNMLCAGGKNGISPCNGDSGGGLVFKLKNKWYLGGIVSFISKRPNTIYCDPSKYTVFTDVSKYSEWIQKTIETPFFPSELPPCKRRVIRENAKCNMAPRFDHGFLFIGLHNSAEKKIIRMPYSGGLNIMSVGVEMASYMSHDCAEGRLYWCDRDVNYIYSAKYDGTDKKPFITTDTKTPHGVSVDWISRRLYWADWDKKMIEIAMLDDPEKRTALIHFEDAHPYLTAVDPLRNRLYWVMTQNDTCKIGWSDLQGSKRHVLDEKPRKSYIEEMQPSLDTGELCFINPDALSIECIDPYSKKIRTVVSNLIKPWGLTITDEKFYWSDIETKKIESIDEHEKKRTFIAFTSDEPRRLMAVTDKCPFYTSPCATGNGNCSEDTICLSPPGASSKTSCIHIRHSNDTEKWDEKIVNFFGSITSWF